MVGTRSSLARAKRAATANNQFTHQSVASMGTLDNLPPEIRNRINKMVLVEPERVKLQCYQPLDKLTYVVNGKAASRTARDEVAPVDHKRISRHRGRQWIGKEWIEVPSKTALTQVNR